MFSQVKLWTGVVAVALIGLLAWRVNVWRNGYLERDAAVAERNAIKATADKFAKDTAEALQRGEDRSNALLTTLTNVSGALATVASTPINPVVYDEKPAVNGKCRNPRIGPEWVGVYNQTSDIASAAVRAPN